MASEEERDADLDNQDDDINLESQMQSLPDSYKLLDASGEGKASNEGWNKMASVPVPRDTYGNLKSRKPRRRAQAGDIWTLIGCNLTVFVSSVCIMVLELTASRLIGRHVGNSLYTWTSVIGVVLAGITIGNYIGGFLADRVDPRKALGWLFLISSMLCFSVIWLNQNVPSTERPEWMNWPGWVFYVVAGIFLLPSVALGTISPVVASIALSRSTKTGITVGNVYAWGALGSIAGTFLAGFWLIGMFGCNAIVVMTSATLAAMGILVVSKQYVFRAAVFFGWLQFVAVIGLAASAQAETFSDIGWKLAGAPDRDTFEKLEAWVEDDAPQALEPQTRSGLVAWYRQGLMDSWKKGDRRRLERWLGADPGTEIDQSTRKRLENWLFSIGSDESVNFWSNFGMRLGKNLHDLGLILKLRADDPSEYHDESNYSYINVSYDVEDGDDVMFLKLDKLIHSYYNPSKPTELYYDYELIYAAITERMVAERRRKTSIPLEPFSGQDEILKALPSWVRYDAESQLMEIDRPMTEQQREELLAISPVADYIRAVDELHRMTNGPDWGGFNSVGLKALPAGVSIPEALSTKLVYDPNLHLLSAYDILSDADRQQLLSTGLAGRYQAFRNTVNSLFAESRHVSTMFIGGGGFIFPRWIEAKFPDNPIIDVAELDPAVKLAVQLRMGLPPDDQTLVKTHIGDARNFVDDRLQQNNRLQRNDQPPRLYNFVYGDAFNDFSVPWHLTTQEFSNKIKSLLTPDGVYMVNIIDIYPRTVYPPIDVETYEETPFAGDLPDELLANYSMSLDWEGCPAPYQGVEVRQIEEGGGYCLAVRGNLSATLRERLLKLNPNNAEFAKAVRALYLNSRENRAGGFLGSYVKTIAEVFPNVYVFSSEVGEPHDSRDTFVIIAAMKKIDVQRLGDAGGYWYQPPFAWIETDATGGDAKPQGQFVQLIELARGILLTDNFAPVDNLLSPVFKDQGY